MPREHECQPRGLALRNGFNAYFRPTCLLGHFDLMKCYVCAVKYASALRVRLIVVLLVGELYSRSNVTSLRNRFL